MASGAETASERVTVLMTPGEKARLEERARSAGVSAGAFVRRAVDAYDPDASAELEELAALAAEFTRSNRDALEALDRALAAFDATRAQLDRRPA